MGVVYEAFQGSLNRHVALKLLPERGNLARFHRDAALLHHTNIVPVFGVGEHAGRHYYVMQYIDGESLDERLRRLRHDVAAREPDSSPGAIYREAARIGVQAAEALAYAHGQGVIHRDVKPSSLLIHGRSTVWITDFGLAKDATVAERLTLTGVFMSTLRYVAPERTVRRGDERVDIYGLGVTLYELICGRAAYAEDDRVALLHQHLNHDPPRPRQVDPRIPRDLETIVLKAMARDPAHRYATAAAMTRTCGDGSRNGLTPPCHVCGRCSRRRNTSRIKRRLPCSARSS
jgi:serine/threonine protein kinase